MLEIILFIVIVAIAFIVANWFAHLRDQERANEFERELDFDEVRDKNEFQQRFDDLFDNQMNETGNDREPDLFDERAHGARNDEKQVTPLEVETEVAQEPEIESEPKDLMLAFTVMAPEGKVFVGRAIKAALENHDLHFGDMQLYHKYASNRQILFSAANVLAPGTLLPNSFVSMTSPGLLLFARLPGPDDGLKILDELLEAAQKMTDDLGGLLCDEARALVNDETLTQMRARIMAFEEKSSEQ